MRLSSLLGFLILCELNTMTIKLLYMWPFNTKSKKWSCGARKNKGMMVSCVLYFDISLVRKRL